MGKKRKSLDSRGLQERHQKRPRDGGAKLAENAGQVGALGHGTAQGIRAKAKHGAQAKTVIDPRPDWHAFDLPELEGPVSDNITTLAPSIDGLREYGRTLLEQDGAVYAASFLASSSHKLLGTIMSSGTIADKVSALTLAVRESPLHNTRAFESLLSLAHKKSRGQAIYALEAIVDLFGPGDVLPASRRLKVFRNQPGLLGALQRARGRGWKQGDRLPEGITNPHLIFWVFEDWLKTTYFQIIQLLESWSRDEVGHFRTKALDFVYGLLSEKPEQEANLLALLVNKLGDKDRRLASRASYLLIQIQSTHPGMKDVIVQAIAREVLFRPGQALRARYYAVNTLNQTVLGRNETSIADMLLRVYFDLFSSMLKGGEMSSFTGEELSAEARPLKKPNRERATSAAEEESTSQLAEKLISAILTGINRAAPYVDGDDDVLESRLDVLFRIAHSSNFNTSIQALLLIQHLSSRRNVGVDRFYRTLYESLLDPRLAKSSKHTMYINLLMRAMKNDSDPRRIKAFAKRMLQVLSLHQPPFVSGVLYTLSTLHNTMSPLLKEPEEDPDGDEDNLDDAKSKYDGRKRDPEYSNAHKSCLWEMIPIMRHFHPSVLVYATSVMETEAGKKTEKPVIESLSLIRFLDKFSYRNPKEKEVPKGGSIMQPLLARNTVSDPWLRSRKPNTGAQETVNSAAFWSRRREDVAAEDAFFHEYFNRSGKASQAAKRSAAESDVDPQHPDDSWDALGPGVNEEEGSSDDGDMEAFMDEMVDSESDIEMENWDSSSDGPGPFSDEDEAVEVEADASAEEGGTSSAKKRKSRRDLPTFASAEDYLHLLGDDAEM